MQKNQQKKTLNGGCLCGAVTFIVHGEPRDVVNCHCQQCRRTHGNFAAYTATTKNNLILIGERGLEWYRSSDHARRGFCRYCGASLFWESLDKDHICISAGAVSAPTGLRTVRHVFVADAGDYYEINDTLEKFPGSMWAKTD